jgi:hypothetical protein
MLKKNLMGLAIVLAAAFAGAAQAETVAVTPDGVWHQFDVDGDLYGSLDWVNVAADAAISFNLVNSAPAYLTVVDGAFAGDRFEVFDNGISLGFTSAVAAASDGTSLHDFDAALADSRYSFATFLLGVGSHQITGLLSQPALVDGDALNATLGALKVAPVPLPAAAWLLLSGSGAFGLFARRRRPVAA